MTGRNPPQGRNTHTHPNITSKHLQTVDVYLWNPARPSEPSAWTAATGSPLGFPAKPQTGSSMSTLAVPNLLWLPVQPFISYKLLLLTCKRPRDRSDLLKIHTSSRTLRSPFHHPPISGHLETQFSGPRPRTLYSGRTRGTPETVTSAWNLSSLQLCNF